jgi:hypothetical protein
VSSSQIEAGRSMFKWDMKNGERNLQITLIGFGEDGKSLLVENK